MRQNGTVKFFNHSRGFGFITPDDGGKDVFLHISALQRSGLPAVDEGQRVTFETEPDRRGKGPQAVNVQLSRITSPHSDSKSSGPPVATFAMPAKTNAVTPKSVRCGRE